jgi:O-antigen/teichoic acid export membrane protein
MERSRRFISSLGSGYASVAASSILSLVSIPVALSQLGREGFGVASTIIQIGAFSQVLQLGVGPSVARFLVDFKNSGNPSRLGAFMKIALIIGLVQGLILMVLALAAPTWLATVFRIPSDYLEPFKFVVFMVLCTSAIGLALNPFHQLLYASQRIDLINYTAIASQGLATAALVIGLWNGLSLHSYVLAAWVGSLSAAAMVVSWSIRHGICPPFRGLAPDWAILPSLLRFSGNVMFASIGLQLIAIAPAVVINRLLGAAAMGDWSVGTKLLQLGMQLTNRVSNAAEPTLWEIYSRGQNQWCCARLKQTTQISAVVAAMIGAIVLALNGNFVSLWSGEKVSWPWVNDLIGGCMLLVAAMASTWCMLPGITKQLGRMALVYPAEGLLVLALLLVPAYVTSAATVLGGMLASMALVRLSYGAARCRSDLGESVGRLIICVRRPLLFWLGLLPLALAVRYIIADNTRWQVMALGALVVTMLFGGLAYAFGLSASTKLEARGFFSRKSRSPKA